MFCLDYNVKLLYRVQVYKYYAMTLLPYDCKTSRTLAKFEIGNHQELLAQRGLYHTLYQLQYRDQEQLSIGLTRLSEFPTVG